MLTAEDWGMLSTYLLYKQTLQQKPLLYRIDRICTILKLGLKFFCSLHSGDIGCCFVKMLCAPNCLNFSWCQFDAKWSRVPLPLSKKGTRTYKSCRWRSPKNLVSGPYICLCLHLKVNMPERTEHNCQSRAIPYTSPNLSSNLMANSKFTRLLAEQPVLRD